ncbi:hypothetical protein QC764_0098110 [Podospora pseudoanserina]|uniref:Uncharacterized protein n=1 Tax=Podospora pseudoanserina TaxID=2609844 RepID=A0ABR0HUA8_9PEZI|nr:hypothetical protein QC764_0098110 [Podospora pseudoanserina]
MHSSKSCMKPKRGRKEKKKPQKPGVPRLSSLFAARPSSRANILEPLTSTAAPDVKARLFSCPVLMRLRKSQSGSPATIHGSPFGASASSSSRAHFGEVAVSCGAATATPRLIIRAGSRSVLLTLTPLRPLVRFGYNQALAAYR